LHNLVQKHSNKIFEAIKIRKNIIDKSKHKNADFKNLTDNGTHLNPMFYQLSWNLQNK
jgi:hypothetical protein